MKRPKLHPKKFLATCWAIASLVLERNRCRLLKGFQVSSETPDLLQQFLLLVEMLSDIVDGAMQHNALAPPHAIQPRHQLSQPIEALADRQPPLLLGRNVVRLLLGLGQTRALAARGL